MAGPLPGQITPLEHPSIESLPSGPGSYALHLLLPDPVRLPVGRLGTFPFPAGDYFYLGSARGPGGLRARLRHHARVIDHPAASSPAANHPPAARPHWHIDWLRRYATLLGGWVAASPTSLECQWSQALLCIPGAAIPAPGFGSADCRRGCPAHLLAFFPTADLAGVELCLSATGVVLQPFKLLRSRQTR